ncbi:DHA2 family efflux MFS transporter permease subunit [Alkalibacter rhizosphaerae]|uniref:DHA2 family efflux MFS transporter permease subunit n=1 Tax=Alkalibacter rhizosphaerae TaxID=2815577 RepID=A0A975AJ55_9FIRM|nr:DHA2 family efflux MFS transporter permease subunit [Alkalibacter rhizosphaerae]QSX09384.1 DHA2 family efflux MFS transporter permease subunit [Alkalibacter rhizosphaerae]
MKHQNEIPQHKLPMVIALILGAIIAILNTSLLLTAIPHIMKELSISESTAQWLTTGFMLVNGVMIPIMAFLIEKFTTRHLFFAAMSFVAIGSVIAIVAHSFPLLMLARVIQAMGAGILMPLMQTVLMIIYPKHKRGQVMGAVGMVISFAPAVGPTISGIIVDFFSWKAIFWVILIVAIVDLAFAFFTIRDVTQQANPKVDILSMILSTLGFGGILYGASMAGSLGWTNSVVLGTLIVGLLSLVFFSKRQFSMEHAMLDLRVFKNTKFTLSVVITTIMFGTLIASEVLLPMFMQNTLGMTALQSGLMIFPGAAIMGVISLISGRLFDMIGARLMSLIGLVVVAISSLFFARLTMETSFMYLTIVFAFRMAGLALITTPLSTLGLNQLEYALIPHGTAAMNTVRQVGASISTAVFVSILMGASISNGSIFGINVTFGVMAAVSVISLIMGLFIRDDKRELETREV